jgi:hypothetical protein
LKEHVLVARIHFCNQFLQSVHNEADPHSEFFYYEAWISLCGEVNSQYNRYWSAENPGLIHELIFHDEKTGIWWTTNACHEIAIFMYELRVNNLLHWYTNCIWSDKQHFSTSAVVLVSFY